VKGVGEPDPARRLLRGGVTPRTPAAFFLAVLALLGWSNAAAADLGSRATDVVVVGELQVRFQTGICTPSAAALGCTAAYQTVPFEARTLSCTANGVFEGMTLPPNAPCEDRFEGALVGYPTGSTPNCLTAAPSRGQADGLKS